MFGNGLLALIYPLVDLPNIVRTKISRVSPLGVSSATLMLLMTATAAHAAFGPPAILGQLLLALLAIPPMLGVLIAIKRMRKRASFVQDMLWISPLGLLVVALGFAIPSLDGEPRGLGMFTFFFCVLVLLGYLVARLIAVITRRGM